MPIEYAKFPNAARRERDPEIDAVLSAELEQAGIPRMEGCTDKLALLITKNSGVQTTVLGAFQGWSFTRYWYYWVVEGPGLPLDVAMVLWTDHGKHVRCNGDAGCRSPWFWNKGFATTKYHVFTQEGLAAMVEAIDHWSRHSRLFMQSNYPQVLENKDV